MKNLFLMLSMVLSFVQLAKAQEAPPVPRLNLFESGIEIPFKVYDNKILLEARINGIDVEAILDSGSGGSHITMDNALADEMNLASYPPMEPQGVGLGKNQTIMTINKDVSSIELPGLKVTNVGSIKMDLFHSLGRFTDGPVRALFGGLLFNNFIVTIDYEKRIITLHDPKDFDYKGDGQVVPVKKHGGRILAEVETTFKDNSKVTGSFTVDTGARIMLMYHNSYMSNREISLPPNTSKGLVGIGFSGEVIGHVGRAKNLRVGGINFKDPIITYSTEQTQNMTKIMGDDGILGYGFLKHFKVIYDYSRDRIILEKQMELKKPVFNKSGMYLVPAENANGFIVQFVYEGSPASRRDIRKGDLLTKVDGKTIEGLSLMNVRDKLNGKTGSELDMVLVRNGKSMNKRIVLRDIVE